ncbi:hypothetical protein Efla_007787 [Eimeria flavescens]
MEAAGGVATPEDQSVFLSPAAACSSSSRKRMHADAAAAAVEAAAASPSRSPHADSTEWPYISTHYREWLFSPSNLKHKRAAVHAAALQQLQQAAPELAAGAPSAEQLLLLQQYFALQLLLIFQKKGVKPPALEAACLFFHRFFLSSSPLRVDVRVALFACLLLALKAIDAARHYTLQELLGDIEDLDLAAVVSLELPVCEGLAFQLLLLDTRQPLDRLISFLVSHAEENYQLQQQQTKCQFQQQQEKEKEKGQQERDKEDDGPTSSNSSNSSNNTSNTSNSSSNSSSSSSLCAALDALELQHIGLLQQLVRLQEDAEAACLLMHASPHLPLLHAPPQLALAALLGSPVKRELLQQGLDVEAVLKKHLLKQHNQAAASAAAEAAPAAAAAREAEAHWVSVQRRVAAIVSELRALRCMQKQIQNTQLAQEMSALLDKTIDAAEVLALEISGTKDADGRREKKKKRKQKKTKKENTDKDQDKRPADSQQQQQQPQQEQQQQQQQQQQQ